MNNEHLIKQFLPFAECRYSQNSGRHYKSHMHKTFSIGAIDNGEVIYNVEGKTAKLQQGSLALINPETLHSCNPTESCKRSYYILYLDTEWCLELQQSMWRVEVFNPVNKILLNDDSIYQQYIAAMKTFLTIGDRLEMEQILVDLVEKIFLLACKPFTVPEEPSVQIEWLKHQLSTNLGTETSMRELALKQEANPYTLLRQFKTAVSITPHAYRLNCRIELAKELIKEGIDLSKVALDCGFFDQSHFHRHFKAITTMTPGEYQTNFRE